MKIIKLKRGLYHICDPAIVKINNPDEIIIVGNGDKDCCVWLLEDHLSKVFSGKKPKPISKSGDIAIFPSMLQNKIMTDNIKLIEESLFYSKDDFEVCDYSINNMIIIKDIYYRIR